MKESFTELPLGKLPDEIGNQDKNKKKTGVFIQ